MNLLTSITINCSSAECRIINSILTTKFPGVRMIGNFESFAEGKTAIEKFNPGIIFINTRNCEKETYEYIKRKSERGYEVIVISDDKDKNARLKSNQKTIEYVIIPIKEKAFVRAMQNAVDNCEQARLAIIGLNHDIKGLKQFEPFREMIIHIKDGNKTAFVKAKYIRDIESDNSSVTFYFNCEIEGSTKCKDYENTWRMVSSQSIKEWETELFRYGIVRCHNRNMVNVESIRFHDKAESGKIKLDNKKWLYLSGKYGQNVLELLGLN